MSSPGESAQGLEAPAYKAAYGREKRILPLKYLNKTAMNNKVVTSGNRYAVKRQMVNRQQENRQSVRKQQVNGQPTQQATS